MVSRLEIVSPEGIAVWPRLNEPDREFDPAGLFHVKLRVSGKEAEGFMHEVTEYRDENYQASCAQKGKKKLEQNDLPWQEDEENPGEFLISFKLKAKVTARNGDSWEQRPTLLDSQLKPATGVSIGAGSKLKISTVVNAYCTPSGTTGVTLWCKAVQIIELVEYGGGSHGLEATKGFEIGGSDEDLIASGDGANF